MEEKISVINVDDVSEIVDMYKESEINKYFGGYRPDRILASEISFLIRLNEYTIGFILLVREETRKDSLGIDMALKKEYRNKGYATTALEILRDNYFKKIKDDLHVQVRKEDSVANKIINVLDCEYIESINDSDFYKILRKNK